MYLCMNMKRLICMIDFEKCLIAVLAGALLIILIRWIWFRDEAYRLNRMKNEYLRLHFNLFGKCDYIFFKGDKYVRENKIRTGI